MRWSWLFNRWIVTFGTIAVVSALWNLYVVFNDDGVFSGRIIDTDGRPVAGATVKLGKHSLVAIHVSDETDTDAEGRFRFTGHTFYHIHIEARKEGVGVSKTYHHLYFRGQNKMLSEPLRLEPGPTG